MTYKSTKAYLPISGKSPKEAYYSFFQETLNQQFYNSSNWWSIKEEYPEKSKNFREIDVKIDHVIDGETGVKLGDDWKTVLFKDVGYDVKIGKLFFFDENYWIVTNTESIKSISSTCTIRRCNNVLKWIDETTGAYYEHPCAMDYLVEEPKDRTTANSSMLIPSGFLSIYVQLNAETLLIKENQRFIFGNQNTSRAFRIMGLGNLPISNLKTFDSYSGGLLYLKMHSTEINYDTDDIVNGIANKLNNQYVINLNKINVEGSINNTFQFVPTILLNNSVVIRDVKWASSNSKIAEINSSGLMTMKNNGIAKITASLLNNSTINTEATVIISATPEINYDIRINPTTNYILENIEKTFEVYLYQNGIKTADEFTFVCISNEVPSTSYIFNSIDGNSFSIKNLSKNIYSYLTIRCTSNSNIKDFNIYLRGAW